MNHHLALTQLQHEALTGLMLGDGHLVRQKNASLIVVRSYKDKEYIEYEAEIFKNFLAPAFQNGVKLYSHFDKRNEKTYETYRFNTSDNPSLTEYHDIWYKDKIKIVPNTLALTPVIIAHWIADDGHITFNKLPYRLQCDFATHSFTEEENHFLADLLQNRYHEKFKVSPSKGKYFFIRAYDSACRTMIADIDKHFKMDRKRLWDKPESRFYHDPPKRQVNRKDMPINRIKTIEEVINSGLNITMKQLMAQMDHNCGGTIGYKTLNEALKPYLDNGKISKEVDKFNNNTTTIRVLK